MQKQGEMLKQGEMQKLSLQKKQRETGKEVGVPLASVEVVVVVGRLGVGGVTGVTHCEYPHHSAPGVTMCTHIAVPLEFVPTSQMPVRGFPVAQILFSWGDGVFWS